MQNIQTWDRTRVWDPTNPNQQPLQYYSPVDMGYRSAYWNEVPTTAQDLMGILPKSNLAKAGIAVAAVAGSVFLYRVLLSRSLPGLMPKFPSGKNLKGVKHRRRRRRR